MVIYILGALLGWSSRSLTRLLQHAWTRENEDLLGQLLESKPGFFARTKSGVASRDREST